MYSLFRRCCFFFNTCDLMMAWWRCRNM